MQIYMFLKEKGNIKKIYLNLKGYKEISKSNKLFDEKYYLKKYPNIKNSKIKPLDHYIYYGYKEGKNPSKIFDGNYYLKKYSDVKSKNINPLIHYVLYGEKEGRFKNKNEEEKLSTKKLQKKIIKQKKTIKSCKTQIRKIKIEIKDNKDESEDILENQNKKIDSLKNYIYSLELRQEKKEKITCEITNFKDYGITKEKRMSKIVISLTSNPNEIHNLHYTIYTLLTQTMPPDEVILWLAKEQFPNLEEDLPQKLKKLEKHGLSIEWFEDIKSYNKLIPTLKEYPEDIIVTANHNVFYPEDWLEELYKQYDGTNIIAHKIKKIRTDLNNNFTLINPKQIGKKNINIQKENSILNFPLSDGGILYPPNTLHGDVFNQLKFMEINDSDFWFWLMTILNKRKVKTVPEGYSKIEYTTSRSHILNNKQFKDESDYFNKNTEKFSYCYPKLFEKIKEKLPPKVSVVVPVYNVELYLEEFLDSIINQTLKDIEIICVNDGSTDNSLKILEHYSKKDKRIKIINQKNQGAGVARNKGIEIANGDYLSILDSDDFYELNMLELMYSQSKKTDADITICKTKGFDNESEEYFEMPWSLKKNLLPYKEVFNYKDIEKHIFTFAKGWTWDKLYKSSFVFENKLKFQDLENMNDALFVFLSFVKAKKITVVDEFLVYQRKNRPNSLSNTIEKTPLCFYDALKELKEELIKSNIFNEVEESFLNCSTEICFWFLDSSNNQYDTVHSELKKTFNKLGFYKYPKDYFHNISHYHRLVETIAISIIIPVYNTETYLKECLDSVINQTLKNIEILCINDGSTDNSLKILEEYAKKDNRIKIISKPNSGYGNTMNIGLDNAKGEYIGIIESDDFANLDMFKTLYNTAKKYDVEVVKSNYNYYFTEQDKYKSRYIFSKDICNKVFSPSSHPEILALEATICTAIYKREFLNRNKIRFNETPGASYQDTSFSFKVLVSANALYILHDKFLNYRRDNDASSVNSSGKVFALCDELESIEKFLDDRPIKKRIFEDIINYRKFDLYIWNYNRIDDKFKINFLKRFSEEFKVLKNSNKVPNKFFSKNEVNDLNKIINDYSKFNENIN